MGNDKNPFLIHGLKHDMSPVPIWAGQGQLFTPYLLVADIKHFSLKLVSFTPLGLSWFYFNHAKDRYFCYQIKFYYFNIQLNFGSCYSTCAFVTDRQII